MHFFPNPTTKQMAKPPKLHFKISVFAAWDWFAFRSNPHPAEIQISKVQRLKMIRSIGKVYLVGAGPGDPDLITVKGLRLLQSADTVIHDRLIPTGLLDYCQANTEIIDVGKYPDHYRISQTEINELIVAHALRGKIVVRLKGGDPFVFGRGTEELEACVHNEIPCEVVPGISSCIAAASAAGIPVTSRGIARSFVVITGQTAPGLGKYSVEFDALKKIDTVVVLMGRKNMRQLVDGLLAAGKSPDTPVACIERATCPDQLVVASTLDRIVEQVELLKMSSPMVTIIGEVAGMANPYQQVVASRIPTQRSPANLTLQVEGRNQSRPA